MEWNKQTVKGLLLVVCGGVAFYAVLQNPDTVARAFRWLFRVLAPFISGGCIAFVLNVPMRAIERKMFPKTKKSVRRPLALVLTLAAVLAVLSLASLVIGPGIYEAGVSLAEQIPAAAQRFYSRLLKLEEYLPQLELFLQDISSNWGALSQKAMALLETWGSRLISSGSGFVGGVVSGVTTFFISLIFAFYLLVQKEKLAQQGRQVLFALLPRKRAEQTLEVLRLANRTFSGFLSGQCLEAVILGTLFVVTMSIFRMPYALLVGVLIALTALIPIVGAFIGCGIGALLIAISNPMQALLFIVLFLVLQQVEGNLIYPHVVGNSVGLPSIWVLAAVMLGGSLMGVVGMLFFIPLCSVLYALFRSYVHGKLAEKQIPEEIWRDPPQ